jgi:hypothetical protein
MNDKGTANCAAVLSLLDTSGTSKYTIEHEENEKYALF